VREQLSVINRVQRVFAFGLDYDSAIYHQVCSKAAIKFYVFVDEGYGFLALHFHAQVLQFVGEAGFVGGL